MAKNDQGVDLDYLGNSLLNMGEESVSPSVILTPPIIVGNQNNYNPVNLQTSSILRISSSGAIQITGIVAPNTPRWKKMIIFNIGASNITLIDASALSSVANRFAMNGSLLLNPNEGSIFLYDQTSQRWRCFGKAI
jgi:hypothetical protein